MTRWRFHCDRPDFVYSRFVPLRRPLLDRLPAQGPTLGRSAPRREITDIEGGKYALGAPSRRHLVLIFTSPNCPWCEQMAPRARRTRSPTYKLSSNLRFKFPRGIVGMEPGM